jgi:hypothetical protein
LLEPAKREEAEGVNCDNLTRRAEKAVPNPFETLEFTFRKL